MTNWDKYEPFFYSWEFDSPDSYGSGLRSMDDKFIDKLFMARKIAEIPFMITSGYRTPEHNKKIGGVLNSAHTKGKACDIACSNSRHRYIIVKAMIVAGFNRIGIGKDFIHCDDDDSKDPDVIWLY